MVEFVVSSPPSALTSLHLARSSIAARADQILRGSFELDARQTSCV